MAIMIFASATQGWLVTRSRLYESVILLFASSMLFIPNQWLKLAYDPYKLVHPKYIEEVLPLVPQDKPLSLRVRSEDALGDIKEYYAYIKLDGETTEERLSRLGLSLRHEENFSVVEDPGFMSEAETAGIGFDDVILYVRKPLPQPDYRIMYLIAFTLTGLVGALQWRRGRSRKQLEYAGASA